MSNPEKRYLKSLPEEIRSMSEQALAFIGEAGLLPHPVNYFVGYEYVWGLNRDLVREVESQSMRGQGWNDAMMGILYERLQLEVQDNPMDALSGELMGLLAGLLARVKETHGSMEGFKQVLLNNQRGLQGKPSLETLHAIIGDLMGAAQQATETTQVLQAQLDTTQKEAESLRAQLDQIKRESELDTLTGAYNRRALERIAAALMAAADESDGRFSMLVIDIDHFKTFNDTYGHLLGDEVLKRVVHSFRQQVRGSDCVARYGGEEFVILLPDTPLAGALKVAEAVRNAVEQIVLVRRSTQERLSQVTVSVGVSEYRKGEGLESQVDRTDAALYRAKRDGRNRVLSAD